VRWLEGSREGGKDGGEKGGKEGTLRKGGLEES